MVVGVVVDDVVSTPNPPAVLPPAPLQVPVVAVAHVLVKPVFMVIAKELADRAPYRFSPAKTLHPLTNVVTWLKGVVAVNPEAASVTVNDNVGVVSFVRVPSAASLEVIVIS